MLFTFNFDPESSKAISGVATRFATVIYCFSVMCLVLLVLVGVFNLLEDHTVILVCSMVGLVIYGIGWGIRFVITGNSAFLFRDVIFKKISEFRGIYDQN